MKRSIILSSVLMSLFLLYVFFSSKQISSIREEKTVEILKTDTVYRIDTICKVDTIYLPIQTLTNQVGVINPSVQVISITEPAANSSLFCDLLKKVTKEYQVNFKNIKAGNIRKDSIRFFSTINLPGATFCEINTWTEHYTATYYRGFNPQRAIEIYDSLRNVISCIGEVSKSRKTEYGYYISKVIYENTQINLIQYYPSAKEEEGYYSVIIYIGRIRNL